MQYDKYDDDYDQNVNPAAGSREAGTDVRTEKAEQPQDEQDDDDCPQHEISPLEWLMIGSHQVARPDGTKPTGPAE
jgi:hypothetical protein